MEGLGSGGDDYICKAVWNRRTPGKGCGTFRREAREKNTCSGNFRSTFFDLAGKSVQVGKRKFL